MNSHRQTVATKTAIYVKQFENVPTQQTDARQQIRLVNKMGFRYFLSMHKSFVHEWQIWRSFFYFFFKVN